MDEEKIKSRKAFLINLLYFAAIIALAFLFFKYAFGIFVPFLIGFIFAIVLDPLIRFLSRKMKIKRTLWSIVLVVIVWFIVGFILFKIGQIVYDQAVNALSYIQSLTGENGKINEIYQQISSWVGNVFDSINNNAPQLTATIDTAIEKAGDALVGALEGILVGITNFAFSVPDLLISLIVTVMASIFISIDYPHIRTFLAAQLTRKNRAGALETKNFFKNKIFSIVRAYAIIISITFVELLLGFSLIGINNALLMALLISLLDLLPIIGTATFLVPWGIICIICGDIFVGIGLIVIAIIVSVVREVIQPKIVGSQIGLNPLLTLMSMYVGLKVLGLLGMFVVPLVLIFIKNLNDTGKLNIWKTPDSDLIATVEKADEAEEIMRQERALQRKAKREERKREKENKK